MSVRMGDHFIKLSTTMALNKIRKEEELEKGWRKDEIALPAELRDQEPVHVVPLMDLGRFLLLKGFAFSLKISQYFYVAEFRAP